MAPKTQHIDGQPPLFEDSALYASGITPKAEKKDRRWRGQFRFWLDANKSDELELGQQLEALKTKRGYASTIRDSLRLIFDLRQKRVTVLEMLFPWVAEHYRALYSRTSASAEFEALIAAKVREGVQQALGSTTERFPSMPAPPVRVMEPAAASTSEPARVSTSKIVDNALSLLDF